VSTTSAKTWPKMTSREEFCFLADLILARSSGDETTVTLRDRHSGTTRFANNQVIQNVDTRHGMLEVTVAFGKRHGTASTTDFTAGSVLETLARAERVAHVSPEDPEYLSPPEPQFFARWDTARPETIAAGPSRRLEYANEAIGLCRMESLLSAGIVTSSVCSAGIASNNGLFGYETRTEARFSITVQSDDATGWNAAAHRSIDHLKIQERTLAAINKAKRGCEPMELPPGQYPVVLEPAAVAGLWAWLMGALDAKSYQRGVSPFAGRLGKRVVDTRLTLNNSPEHADLFGVGFTAEGLPSGPSTWIDCGVLRQLAYDRFTAKVEGIKVIPTLEAPVLSVKGAGCITIKELVKQMDHAILVSNLWYIRPVNPNDLTVTGMTRDGTFLVEKGEIVGAVKNFRFHDSLLRAFQDIGASTVPLEAVTAETGKILAPAMILPRFHFSSVTRF